MDWKRYKQICDTPNVFSRWMLEQTGELIAEALAVKLRASMTQPPVAKPEAHQGGIETDMFELSLGPAEIRAVIADLRLAEQAGRRSSGTVSRGLGGFQEAWNEYLSYLAEGTE